MAPLQQRLATVLADALSVEEESDGALTVRHDGTLASLRVVNIAEDLDLVSLTQILAWDLPLTKRLRDRVAREARESQLGMVTLVEKTGPTSAVGKSSSKRNSTQTVDVMLRYNFPGAGLTDDALRTLVLLVLDSGAEIRRSVTA